MNFDRDGFTVGDDDVVNTNHNKLYLLIVVIVLSIIVLYNCIANFYVRPSSASECQASGMGEAIIYFADERTGLCFGALPGRMGLTEVPCDKVKHLLVK